MTATTDRLLNSITSGLAGSSPNAVRLELFNVIDEFCRESLSWREYVPVTLDTTHTVYDVRPTSAQVAQAFNFRHPTHDLYRAFYAYGQVTLMSVPTVTDALYPLLVYSALAPEPISLIQEDISVLLPEDVWNDNEQAFFAGTMSRMTMQIAKPYSNPQMALVYRRDFWNKIAHARQNAKMLDTAPGQGAWRYPRWVK